MSDTAIIESLGAFPIIQIAVAGAIAAAAVAAWVRGERNRTPGALPPGSTWFFDGPIVKALETLQGCYRLLGEMRQDMARHAEDSRRLHEEELEILRDLRERFRFKR